MEGVGGETISASEMKGGFVVVQLFPSELSVAFENINSLSLSAHVNMGKKCSVSLLGQLCTTDARMVFCQWWLVCEYVPVCMLVKSVPAVFLTPKIY